MSLEKRAFQQFDQLHKSGELLWQENTPRYVESEPFDESYLRQPYTVSSSYSHVVRIQSRSKPQEEASK